MPCSEQGLALIRQFEGFSGRPYRCPAGKMTIGYGHVIGAGEQFPSQGINREMADMLLKKDAKTAERAIERLVTIPLTQAQYDALVSLIYNIGVNAFEKSTLLRLLNRGKIGAAAEQFMRWIYAGKSVFPGLRIRRSAEKSLFLQEN